MENKAIANFDRYTTKNKTPNQRIAIQPNEIIINTNFLTIRIFVDFFLLMVMVYGLVITYNHKHFLKGILVILLLFSNLWIHFNTINIIKINFGEHLLIIRSKNVFKQLFFGQKQYPFSDIVSFGQKSYISWRLIKRYIVYLKTKNSSKQITLTDFAKEAQAKEFVKHLHALVQV